MKTAEAIAKELRTEAARFTKAADILDPPSGEAAVRRKPGPKKGSRRAKLKSVPTGNGKSDSPSPTPSAPMGRSLGMASEAVPVGGPADGAA